MSNPTSKAFQTKAQHLAKRIRTLRVFRNVTFGLGSALSSTYRMAPRPEEKFNAETARKLMTDVLESYLQDKYYDNNLISSLSKSLADVIKHRMKDQGFSPRYKYVCVVTMGEKKNQGMTVCSRCVWNTDTDNYASASYTKDSLFAVATLYALYFE